MYFITTLRICGSIVDDCRTVGFESSYGMAYDKMLNNTCDIFEDGYYQYGVITYIEEGLYANKVEQQWFQWTEKEIKLIDKPMEFGDYQPYIIG